MIGFLFIRLRYIIFWLLVIYLVLEIPEYPNGLSIDHKIVIDYLDVLAWPLASILIVAIVGPDLLRQIKEVTLGSGSIKMHPPNRTGSDQSGRLNNVDDQADEPIPDPNRNYQITDDRTHKLLSSTQSMLAFANINQTIFGTQVDFLRRLVDYHGSLKPEQAKDILDEHIKRAQNAAHKTMEAFVGYLMANSLVIFNDDGEYELTFAGYYFLVFLFNADILEAERPF